MCSPSLRTAFRRHDQHNTRLRLPRRRCSPPYARTACLRHEQYKIRLRRARRMCSPPYARTAFRLREQYKTWSRHARSDRSPFARTAFRLRDQYKSRLRLPRCRCSPPYARTACLRRDVYKSRLRLPRGLAYIQDARTCEDSAYERPVHRTSVLSLRVAFVVFCSLAEIFFFLFFSFYTENGVSFF